MLSHPVCWILVVYGEPRFLPYLRIKHTHLLGLPQALSRSNGFLTVS